MPFYDFLQLIIVLIQVYNGDIRHHSKVCRCGLADILYFTRVPSPRSWSPKNLWLESETRVGDAYLSKRGGRTEGGSGKTPSPRPFPFFIRENPWVLAWDDYDSH